MRTRSLMTVSAVAALVALTAAGASAQPTPTQAPTPTPAVKAPTGTTVEGVFRVGAAGTDASDYLGRVGEYKVLEDALAGLAADLWGEKGGFRFDLSAFNGGDSRNQRYLADLDFNRHVRAHVSYRRFPHRLDHDPITYADASSPLGGTFVTQYTDYDPTRLYGIANADFNAGVEVAARNVRFFLGHDRQQRSGYHQVTTISHCATCHPVSYTREMDELTATTTAGARLEFGGGAVEYVFEARDFEDDAPSLEQVYDRAVQPATLQDIFLNRVQYEQRDGSLPFATVPAIRKYANTIRGNFAIGGEATVNGAFTKSNTRNDDTRLETDYTGGFGRLVMPFRKNLVLRADFRRYDIDSDDVFVNVVEKTAPAGLSAGKTYAEAFPSLAPVDYTRESSLSRTPTEVGVELSYRPFRRTFLRFGYNWEEIARKTYEVEKTTTNSFYVAGRSQFGKKANGRFRFEYDSIEDPFAYEHAAIPAILQPFQSPGNSPLTGLQYFEMYRSRQADLTAFPSSTTAFEGHFTLTPAAGVALTARYRWRDSQNDDLNFSEWGRTINAPGVDLYIAPSQAYAIIAGYGYQRERLDTLFTTLAFNG